jgi:hypothetical protein
MQNLPYKIKATTILPNTFFKLISSSSFFFDSNLLDNAEAYSLKLIYVSSHLKIPFFLPFWRSAKLSLKREIWGVKIQLI